MKVVIVDDDTIICEALKIILQAQENIEVCAIGHNAEEAVGYYREHQADILLMDIRMGEKNGLDAGEEILKEYPNAKILYLTTFSDDEYIVKALNIGAKGYILKQNFNSLPNVLTSIMAGQIVFGEDIVDKFSDLIINTVKKLPENISITEKDLEVIQLVSKGLSNKEIAEQLFLGEGTVRNYISQILAKLSLRDRTQLVIYYFNYLK